MEDFLYVKNALERADQLSFGVICSQHRDSAPKDGVFIMTNHPADVYEVATCKLDQGAGLNARLSGVCIIHQWCMT